MERTIIIQASGHVNERIRVTADSCIRFSEPRRGEKIPFSETTTISSYFKHIPFFLKLKKYIPTPRV